MCAIWLEIVSVAWYGVKIFFGLRPLLIFTIFSLYQLFLMRLLGAWLSGREAGEDSRVVGEEDQFADER